MKKENWAEFQTFYPVSLIIISSIYH